jgi:hypothetical protein
MNREKIEKCIVKRLTKIENSHPSTSDGVYIGKKLKKLETFFERRSSFVTYLDTFPQRSPATLLTWIKIANCLDIKKYPGFKDLTITESGQITRLTEKGYKNIWELVLSKGYEKNMTDKYLVWSCKEILKGVLGRDLLIIDKNYKERVEEVLEAIKTFKGKPFTSKELAEKTVYNAKSLVRLLNRFKKEGVIDRHITSAKKPTYWKYIEDLEEDEVKEAKETDTNEKIEDESIDEFLALGKGITTLLTQLKDQISELTKENKELKVTKERYEIFMRDQARKWNNKIEEKDEIIKKKDEEITSLAITGLKLSKTIDVKKGVNHLKVMKG